MDRMSSEGTPILAESRSWFRFPYLDEGAGDKEKRDAVRAGLAERGLVNGYVTGPTRKDY